MLRSLYSGVSGLTSHQTKMDVIGNNIANVNTYGFKGSTVAFSDIYYQTTKAATAGSNTQGGVNPSQIGYGTQIAAISKNMSRSSFQSSSSALDVAIAGDGFFQVQDKAGNTYYTRAGKLTVDSEGNLVDSNGKFILGTLNANPKNASGLSTEAGSNKIAINVPAIHTASFNAAVTSTTVNSQAIDNVKYKVEFKNGDVLSDFNLDINSGTADGIAITAGPPATYTVTISSANMANIKTVEDLQTKINTLLDAAIKADSPAGMKDFSNGKITISLDTSAATIAGTPGTLNEAQLAAVQAQAVTDILNATINYTATTHITTVPQSFSNLTSFTVSENGTLIGIHPVHGTLTFGRIDLATFDNTNGLEEAGNTYFAATANSGKAKVAVPGFSGSGSLVGSALEMSNVNLAQEFTDMITAQRGFQANARIITTSDSMLEELVNLKR
ncbi:MAG TPA: flagellar hook-basal body complex protein [Oscillospiraceae bacterium]|nr:flagellar hook-basal body complex protein [Oscillospiraceae bacterium]